MTRPTTGTLLDLARVLPGRLAHDQQCQRHTLVVFYRGHWCDYCNDQLRELAQSLQSFRLLGTQLIGITTDDGPGIEIMRERIDNAFPLISDMSGDTIRQLDLVDPFEFRAIPVSLPAVFLVDSAGVVRFHYIGRSPDDRPRTELLLLAAESLSTEKF
jgi:peroxiredoxin